MKTELHHQAKLLLICLRTFVVGAFKLLVKFVAAIGPVLAEAILRGAQENAERRDAYDEGFRSGFGAGYGSK